MSDERIAYVVTSGEYSDYGISAVFDNLEAAKTYAKHWGRIEQYSLNSTQPVERSYWEACITDGFTPGWEPKDVSKHTTNDWVETKSYYPYAWVHGQSGGYIARAVALTKPKAEKIARDLLAQLKYEHETNGIKRLPIDGRL